MVTSQDSLQCPNATVPLTTSHLLRLSPIITFIHSRAKKHSPSSVSLVAPLYPGRRRLTRQSRAREEMCFLKQASPMSLPPPPTTSPLPGLNVKICCWGFQTAILSGSRVQRLATNERKYSPIEAIQANARPSARHVMQRFSPITDPYGSPRSQPILPLIKPKLGPGDAICAA